MKKTVKLSNFKVLIKGGGEMASGVACRLHKSGFKILLTEIEQPIAVRRKVSFCEAVYNTQTVVEGVEAILVKTVDDVYMAWDKKKIPLLVDPQCESRISIKPDVIVDAILAKKNTGTRLDDAPLVIVLMSAVPNSCSQQSKCGIFIPPCSHNRITYSIKAH